LYTKFKQDREEEFHLMSNRKAGEEGARRERANEMMAKLQRSQKAVENFMKERAHQNMLDQEERKLQEEDVKCKLTRKMRLRTH